MKTIAYDAVEDGHRRSYLNTWERELGFEALIAPPSVSVLIKLVRARQVIFSTLDDVPFFFFFVGILRSLFGRKTVGIFLRPQGCFFTHHWKYKFKYFYFKLISAWPGLAPISIIPYFVNSRFSDVSRDWIYDPQNWDLYSDPPDLNIKTPLSAEIIARARGRKIIAALGGLNRFKGFPYFAELASSPVFDRNDFFFVACGPLAHDCQDEARAIVAMGGHVFGEFISDADIWALYGSVAAVWACYPALNDQASGIFGRASQFGVPSIVRAGSFNALQAERMGAPAIAIPFDKPDEAIRLIHETVFSKSPPNWDLVGRLKAESLTRLKTYL